MPNYGLRKQKAQDRLVRRFGSGREATFRHYVEVADRATNTVGRSIDPGVTPFTAGFVSTRFERDDDRGLRGGETKVIVSGVGVGNSAKLDTSWTMQLAGKHEIPMLEPFETVNLDGTAVRWSFRVADGALV